MFKLVLEKAEEPEIQLPTAAGSSKKQESSRKTSICALLTIPKPLTVWITINCGKFFNRWELLGASTGVPSHDKVMQESPDGQGESGLEGPPGSAWASTQKPESVCFTILWVLPTPLRLTGGYPQLPFSEENQLRALVNKSPGHNRSVSIQTPLMTF